MGRLAPDMICMDGTIPRHALPQVLEEMAQLSEHYQLGFCNVFHAGDGNLHPLIIFDAMKEGELEKAEAFGADILRLCVKVGGVLSRRAWHRRRKARPDDRPCSPRPIWNSSTA